MSRISVGIISLVAIATLLATAIGIWRAGQLPPEHDPANLAPTGEKNPASPADPVKREEYEALRKAGAQGQAGDLEFLARHLGDPRRIPVGWVEPAPAPRTAPDPKASHEPKSFLESLRSPGPHIESISSVAQHFLIRAGAAGVAPTLARLRALTRPQAQPRTYWSEEELGPLQAGFEVLSQIQYRLVRAGKLPKTDEPPILLIAQSTRVTRIELGEGVAPEKRESREAPLGLFLLTDRRITTASTPPSSARPAQYEVTPERVNGVLEALEGSLVAKKASGK